MTPREGSNGQSSPASECSGQLDPIGSPSRRVGSPVKMAVMPTLEVR